jgi:hypothetical protein
MHAWLARFRRRTVHAVPAPVFAGPVARFRVSDVWTAAPTRRFERLWLDLLTPAAPRAAEAVGISLGIAFILVVTALVKKYCGISPFR